MEYIVWARSYILHVVYEFRCWGPPLLTSPHDAFTDTLLLGQCLARWGLTRPLIFTCKCRLNNRISTFEEITLLCHVHHVIAIIIWPCNIFRTHGLSHLVLVYKFWVSSVLYPVPFIISYLSTVKQMDMSWMTKD